MPDAVVIGAGHNGLVAAAMLADAGWSVAVLEAQDMPGGAVRTEELTLRGFRHDTFSAFYPFAAASPALAALDLGAHGLRWRRSPLVLAHPTPDGRCMALSTDVDETAESLDCYAPGDGDGWRRLYRRWEELSRPLFDSVLGPFPPLRASARLAAALGPSEWIPFARFALLPARRMAQEELGDGEGGRLLLGGNAAHTDIGPEAAGSGLYGWILACAGQQLGFPVPEGGAGELIAALVRRAEAAGATVTCGTPVTEVVVRGGRAVAVRTGDGTEIDARRAVLADVDAPTLLLDLVGTEHLPSRVVDDFRRRFEWDASTFKVDWALDGPIPWTAEAARRAGTVHVTDSLDELSRYFTDLATGTVPSRPFLLFGQQAVADPSRCPPGTATGWAYTHVPRTARFGPGESEAYADLIEARIEELAPGFRSLVRARHVLPPAAIEAADANLRGGALGGGTQQLHQQLVFRPTTGRGRPGTPVAGLFLAGSSAHPGPGVHGACGANAARAALFSDRVRRVGQALALARRTEMRPPSTRTS